MVGYHLYLIPLIKIQLIKTGCLAPREGRIWRSWCKFLFWSLHIISDFPLHVLSISHFNLLIHNLKAIFQCNSLEVSLPFLHTLDVFPEFTSHLGTQVKCHFLWKLSLTIVLPLKSQIEMAHLINVSFPPLDQTFYQWMASTGFGFAHCEIPSIKKMADTEAPTKHLLNE